MLPYAPLHHLLFDDELEVLVMTSANISGEPIIADVETALERLEDLGKKLCDGAVDYELVGRSGDPASPSATPRE